MRLYYSTCLLYGLCDNVQIRDLILGRGVVMEHRIYRMSLSNRDDEQRINELLENGWLVKEIQTTSAHEEGCFAVVLLEKKER